MRYIKTFEAYVTYNDIKKSASDIENELRGELIKLFTYAGISDHIDDLIYTDQSTDKGIKWQIEVKGKGSDTIHAYKDGKWMGQYEWYLNKKKSSKYDIQQYFLKKYISPLDIFLTAAKSYDYHAEYIDNGAQYRAAVAKNKGIEDQFNQLSASDKKAAVKELEKKINKELVQKVFKF